MTAIHAYFDNIHRILDNVLKEEAEILEEASQMLCKATLSGHNIFAFGCSHAGLLAFELYYRTGHDQSRTCSRLISGYRSRHYDQPDRAPAGLWPDHRG